MAIVGMVAWELQRLSDQHRKKTHVEGDCNICFEEKASHRAILKHSGRVVKSLLIGKRCLFNDGVIRFYRLDGWEMTRI